MALSSKQLAFLFASGIFSRVNSPSTGVVSTSNVSTSRRGRKTKYKVPKASIGDAGRRYLSGKQKLHGGKRKGAGRKKKR